LAQIRPESKQILISIRPEASSLTPAGEPGTLDGSLLETTYLGETAQHLVEIKGCPPIKIAEMNPFGSSSRVHPELGDRVGVRFDPGEVVPIEAD
jgi:ABC-type Fe3+/spermidine/putrescine transport system ATPase subunit